MRLCNILSVVAWMVVLASTSGLVHAQLGNSDSLAFFSDPNAMQVQVSSVANNGRLITDLAGNHYLLHPAARVQWASGERAAAEDISPGMPLRIIVFDSTIEAPVIKLAIIPAL